MSVLVIDVGTSSVRAAIVNELGQITTQRQEMFLPDSPFPGLVEFDALALGELVVRLSADAIAASDNTPPSAVGIANQRASTVVWHRGSGTPVAPAIGWQDLRTVGECLVFQTEGLRFAPNQSATKLAAILNQVDPDRSQDLCFGTVDSWLIYYLTNGEVHVTDRSNASVSGLIRLDGTDWDEALLNRLSIPAAIMPTMVNSYGAVGVAHKLVGAPTITGFAGDQQASMVGQGCVEPGQAKGTFGTGAMLNVVLGENRPPFETQGPGGTFPIITLGENQAPRWGLEAIMLAAGSNVEWLRDDLGLLATADESHQLASSVESTEGVVYVPALLGLGTPHWDYGARGAIFGLTRGTTAAHITRAVLEGIAYRGWELLEAIETDAHVSLDTLRIDGGMSSNPTFVQALANATGRQIEVSPAPEGTTVGAAYLAALGAGTYSGLSELQALWKPKMVVEPTDRLDVEQWKVAVSRSGQWHQDLSALAF